MNFVWKENERKIFISNESSKLTTLEINVRSPNLELKLKSLMIRNDCVLFHMWLASFISALDMH